MNSLVEIVGEKNVLIDEDMGKHTTFRAGGKAKYFVTPSNAEELKRLIAYVRQNQMNYYIIGNGSNLLVRDCGYDGVIIKIGTAFDEITLNGNKMTCGAGAFVSKAAAVACENSLSGLEFAAGIPGLIGGAISMNAGAYGGEFKDIVEQVWLMDSEGNEMTLTGKEMEFAYRKSIVQKKDYIVLGTTLCLTPGDKQEIADTMNGFLAARKEKQPLEYPSAGSTFKRPEGHFAGKLIMDAGLRGFSVGGACVSEKHCGFIINKDHATATDIENLIEKVAEIVYDKFNVKLETEVKII